MTVKMSRNNVSSRARQRLRLVGRPAKKRQAVLVELALASERGERVTLADLARRAKLYDYRDARRIVNDIRRYGLAAVE